MQHHDRAPCDDVCSKILCQPEPLRDIHGREDPYQKAWSRTTVTVYVRCTERPAAYSQGPLTDVERKSDKVISLTRDRKTHDAGANRQ